MSILHNDPRKQQTKLENVLDDFYSSKKNYNVVIPQQSKVESVEYDRIESLFYRLNYQLD